MLATDIYPSLAGSPTNDQTGLTDRRKNCKSVGVIKILATLTGIFEHLDSVLVFVCVCATERRDEKEESQNG